MSNEKLSYLLPVFNSSASQKFEIDYIMPDYEPEIMRIIKCSSYSYITNKTVANDKLTVDITVICCVVYQSYDMKIYTVKTESSCVKNMELSRCECDPITAVNLSGEYCSCKAVGKRRVEIKGSLSISCTAYDRKEIALLDFREENVEFKEETIEAKVLDRLIEKTVTVKEEIEENISDLNIMHSCCNVQITDYRIVTDKIVVKGELECCGIIIDDDLSVSSKIFNIPFGQIIDAEGISEDSETEIDAECAYVNIEASPEENKCFAEIIINLRCRCYNNVISSVVTDAYSTKYEADCEMNEARLLNYVNSEYRTVHQEFSLGKIGEDITNINYVFLTASVSDYEASENGLKIKVIADCYVIGSDSSKTAVGNDKRHEFEIIVDKESDCSKCSYEFKVHPNSYDYRINENGELTVSADMEIKYYKFREKTITTVCSLRINTESIKSISKKAAITIYYAQRGESVFDIAKRYNTSVGSVMNENDLESDILQSKRHLIIPLV